MESITLRDKLQDKNDKQNSVNNTDRLTKSQRLATGLTMTNNFVTNERIKS